MSSSIFCREMYPPGITKNIMHTLTPLYIFNLLLSWNTFHVIIILQILKKSHKICVKFVDKECVIKPYVNKYPTYIERYIRMSIYFKAIFYFIILDWINIIIVQNVERHHFQKNYHINKLYIETSTVYMRLNCIKDEFCFLDTSHWINWCNLISVI